MKYINIFDKMYLYILIILFFTIYYCIELFK